MIVIETPRFFLRHCTLDDIDALAEVLCDHDNMRFFPNRFERKDAEEWIQKNMRRYAEDGVGGWALVLKPDNKFAGYCGLVRREVDGTKEIEVGYALARHAQGQGIATEAARACMNYTSQHSPKIASSRSYAPRISPHAASPNATAWLSRRKLTSRDCHTWSTQPAALRSAAANPRIAPRAKTSRRPLPADPDAPAPKCADAAPAQRSAPPPAPD